MIDLLQAVLWGHFVLILSYFLPAESVLYFLHQLAGTFNTAFEFAFSQRLV